LKGVIDASKKATIAEKNVEHLLKKIGREPLDPNESEDFC
jgi:hypothetical protein